MLSPATRDGPCRAARGVGRHTGCPAQRIVRRVPSGLPRLSWNPRPAAGVGPLRRSAAKRPPVLGRSPLALRPTSRPSGTETRIQHPVAHARLGEDVGGLPRHRPACQLSPLTAGEHQSACRPGMVGQPPGERGTLSGARVVTYRSGRFSGSRAGCLRRPLPTASATMGAGLVSRLQWRDCGGLSPPSLFSLNGRLNGL